MNIKLTWKLTYYGINIVQFGGAIIVRAHIHQLRDHRFHRQQVNSLFSGHCNTIKANSIKLKYDYIGSRYISIHWFNYNITNTLNVLIAIPKKFDTKHDEAQLINVVKHLFI